MDVEFFLGRSECKDSNKNLSLVGERAGLRFLANRRMHYD